MIAWNRAFPPEVARCPVEYVRQSGFWKESVQRFGDTVCWALQQGGAYSEPMPHLEAATLTEWYLDALFGETPEDRLFIYGLDPGFSCWFYQICDLAYVIINLHEDWVALLLATEVD